MIPAEVHQTLLRPHGVHSIDPLPGGMSGASLFRCQADQTLALRKWPHGVSIHRVQQIHAVTIPLAARCELIPKIQPAHPDGRSFAVDSAGAIWDLSSWMPGQPLEFDAAEQSIRVGGQAIGRVHRELQHQGTWVGQVPAVQDRLRRIRWLDEHLPGCFGVNLEGHVHPTIIPALASAVNRLQANWTTVSARLLADLSPLGLREFPLQYVLRDVHREHLLFTDETVSGIIDFDAVRIDSAAVDLARWGASFRQYQESPERTIDEVLAGYIATSPLSEVLAEANPRADFQADSANAPGKFNVSTSEFRTLILAIAESSLWISLANWVVWLVAESRQFADFQRVAERLRRLMEAVDHHPKR